jgi:FkbM family methyltransferase
VIPILKTKTLVPADKGMAKQYSFRAFDNKKIKLEGAHWGLAREIYCRKVYFPSREFQIKENDVVADLGANVGVFTTLAAVCGKQVISIEAQAGFIPIIQSNLKLNFCEEKAIVVHGLIGPGTGIFTDPSERYTSSHWEKEPPVITLKQIMQKHHIQQIDFLKIDIEGSEFDLFAGETGWLQQVRRISMEIHLRFGDALPLISLIKNSGFTVLLHNSNKQTVKHLDGSGGMLFAYR